VNEELPEIILTVFAKVQDQDESTGKKEDIKIQKDNKSTSEEEDVRIQKDDESSNEEEYDSAVGRLQPFF
jgi:hypothetical protein